MWNEKLKEIHIHIMGKVELEVLKETLKNRFSKEISFGPCNIIYKDTKFWVTNKLQSEVLSVDVSFLLLK